MEAVHGTYRAIINRYFTPEHMSAFEPLCRSITDALVAEQPRGEAVELMGGFAQPFALRVQCAFMGWPRALHEPLRLWIGKNHDATRVGDRSAMARIAVEFDGHIRQQLALRRDTGGQADLQARLRREPDNLPAAIDEILRIHPPLIANRRVTTDPVEIGGRKLGAGERLTLIWASANRDEEVFGDPDRFDPEDNHEHNLLYGAGVHVCPGAPLARLELRLLMETLLAHTSAIVLAPNHSPQYATIPAGGFAALQVCLQ